MLRVEDLADSLKHNGQQVPVVLRRRPNHATLQILAGFRRIDAALMLGWRQISAFVVESVTDEQAFRFSVLDNEKRKSYSDMDRAHAIVKYRSMGYKVADLASQVFGLSRQQLYRLESLTELPPPLQLAVAHGTLPTTHAVVLHQALMRLGHEVIDLDQWVNRVVEETMSVRGLSSALSELVPVRHRSAFVAELDGDAISFRSKRIDVAALSEADRQALIAELEEALRALRRLTQVGTRPRSQQPREGITSNAE